MVWEGLGGSSPRLAQPSQAQTPQGGWRGSSQAASGLGSSQPVRQVSFRAANEATRAGHAPPCARRLTGLPGSFLTTEAMRAAGLLLAWVLLRPVGAQQCHPSSSAGVLRFTDTHAEIRVPALHRVPSSLDPLYGLVRHYLDLIQQNPLPTELLRAALNDPSSVRASQVVQYELGYVICAAVALLFTVAVPVAGLCFCYCRSRRRCGGRLRAHRRSLACRRRCLLVCLSITSIIILAICALVTNQRVKEQMEPGLGAVPAMLRTLRQHIANIPQVGAGGLMVSWCLAGLSRSVGLSIHTQLKAMTYAALADLQDRAGDLQTSLHHLQIINKTVRVLTAARAELEPALQERRQRVVTLLDDPRCTSCASVLGRAQSLQLGADYSKVGWSAGHPPALQHSQGSWDAFPTPSSHPSQLCCPSLDSLQGLSISLHLAELRDEMAQVSEKVQTIADGFPLPDYTRRVNKALLKAEDNSQPFLREVERFEWYRWVAGTVLCSIILLIVACNVAGMALGTYGLSKREDPSDYECRGEAGAKFLMIGVGLGFLFSWLLILMVFTTFLVGGNVQTLVCRNWVNQEIYKFIDTPGNLPPSMNLTQQLNLRRDSNLTAAYRECKSGAGLWEVLQLEKSYDLDEDAKYTANFQKRLGDFTAQLGDVRLLRSEGRNDLQTFARSGVDEVDYSRFQEEIPVVQTSLPALARSLDGLQKMQVSGMEDSSSCPCAHRAVLTPLSPSSSPLSKPDLHSTFLPPQEIGSWPPQLLFQLREDVASCQPLATALDNGRVILCDRIADPWNAFWFSLGCCTFFLIPNIIFAIRLTKHFRPIRNRLISTGSEETCPFHIPRVTALKL
uniref:Prominin 2 n=1 Tax=Coturnix japonica TaxID=93934 RepID=A0A8C2TJ05_COTJA